jgi:hypothetical protein
VKFHLESKHSDESFPARPPAKDRICLASPSAEGQPSIPHGSSLSSQLASLTKSVFTGAGKRKRRKVAFSNLPLVSSIETKSSNQNESEGPAPTLDLAAVSEVCQFLRKKCDFKGKAKAYSACIALLRHSEEARYIFYLSSRSHPITRFAQEKPLPPVSLIDYLRDQFQDTVSVVQQYKLALKLTRAVLHFNSTPWFEEEWSIGQLLVIQGRDDVPEDIPLYFNSRLATIQPEKYRQQMVSGSMPRSSKMPLPAAQRRGVDNVTLFCLGTALLEIAHWKPINTLREDYDDDSIDTVRRMANGSTMLGKWYDESIRKCLRCDFAFGTDLRRVELQRAVYSEVICPLEDLIERLDGLNL